VRHAALPSLGNDRQFYDVAACLNANLLHRDRLL